jgi:tetrahedral aminopeptidase
MKDTQKEFFVKLLNEPGPSGFEENVQKLWKEETEKFCIDIKKDVHNNFIATLNPGKENSIMIVGHSDEVGLIVNYINDKGFIYFKPIGGVEPSILSSQRVRIITKKGIVHGLLGRISLHLEDREDRKLPKMHDVWIDIGAKNKKDAEKYVSIGDPVIFGSDYQDLQNNLATSRCFDNRVGIYVVAETLRKLTSIKNLKHTVYGVSSSQEETGVWGARQAAYSYKPTACIAIDVMPCTDEPNIPKERHGDTMVGKGPVITRGVRTNNKIADELIACAKRKKIPYQVDVDYGSTGTDADPISQVRGGIPIGVVSLATRYLHSSVETLSLTDVDKTIDLLTEYIVKTKLEL